MYYNYIYMCLIRYLISVFSVVRSLLNRHYSRLCNSATKIHSKSSALLSFAGFNIYIYIYINTKPFTGPKPKLNVPKKSRVFLGGGFTICTSRLPVATLRSPAGVGASPKMKVFFNPPPKKGPFQKDVLMFRKYVSFRGAINITVSPIKTPPCTTSG